jgi:hypothetical protein
VSDHAFDGRLQEERAAGPLIRQQTRSIIMSQNSANTVKLHRVLATSCEKLYRAFLEADALAKWLPPNGFTCHVDHFEGKVGGTFKISPPETPIPSAANISSSFRAS